MTADFSLAGIWVCCVWNPVMVSVLSAKHVQTVSILIVVNVFVIHAPGSPVVILIAAVDHGEVVTVSVLSVEIVWMIPTLNQIITAIRRMPIGVGLVRATLTVPEQVLPVWILFVRQPLAEAVFRKTGLTGRPKVSLAVETMEA